MRAMSWQRRRVVVLASSIGAMSGVVPMLVLRHPWLGWTWVGLEVALLVYVFMLFARLKRNEGA